MTSPGPISKSAMQRVSRQTADGETDREGETERCGTNERTDGA